MLTALRRCLVPLACVRVSTSLLSPRVLVRPLQHLRGGSLAHSTLAEAPMEKFRKDYAALPYDVVSVDLDFDVGAEETLVTSTLALAPAGGGPLVLDGEDLRLVSVAVDGAPEPREDGVALVLEGAPLALRVAGRLGRETDAVERRAELVARRRLF